MKLVLDFGNTLLKFALFSNEELVNLEMFETTSKPHIVSHTDAFFKKNNINRLKSSIISSVVHYPNGFISHLSAFGQVIELDENTPLPLKFNYKTPATLGKDRMAIAVAASHLYPERNILAINCGTCITYDFVDATGVYLGGAISPGMNMRFKALHTLTDKLPLLEGRSFESFVGRSTEESILSGVLNGIIDEIDGMINRYREIYKNLTIIISGGDMNYFDKKLKNNIFAIPNLVLSGLNIILDFNEYR